MLIVGYRCLLLVHVSIVGTCVYCCTCAYCCYTCLLLLHVFIAVTDVYCCCVVYCSLMTRSENGVRRAKKI